jgi:TolA-binding protein
MQPRKCLRGIKRSTLGGFLLAIIFICSGGLGLAAFGAPTKSPEDQAFQEAFVRFQLSFYALAETHFKEFLAKYTNSVHRADAIFYEARAQLEQSKYSDAMDLLQKSLAESDGLKHEYLFWMAKAQYASGKLTNAAEGFATVAKEFPLSPRRLEAAYDQAEALSQMHDWRAVTNLLQQTNGPFQIAATQDPKNEFAAMGWLLLGEAFLHETNAAEGEKVILGFDAAGLTQDLRWRRQYLLARLQLASGRGENALATSANVLELSLTSPHQAASVFLQGQILEKLGRQAEALAAYTNNFVDSQPQEVQRDALTRIIPLTVALNTLPVAIQTLQSNIDQHPQTKAQDLARVSLAELYLKASVTPPGPTELGAPPMTDTNLLVGALTNLNMVITNFTNSPLLAKARLDRGWCDWLSGNIDTAKVDFQEAADHLPLSTDQAVARFKLADADFVLKDYIGAASNYTVVLTQYDKMPEVTNSLFDLALYQIAEADIRNGDADGARAAVARILREYPGSYFGDLGSLLRGEDLNRKTDYATARKVFLDMKASSPHSPLLPEVDYAIARTHDYEGHWNEAIAGYKQWMTNHPGDPLVPDVEFHLALAYDKANSTNEALAGFTNFLARFPTNESFAPWALNEVADYYYNQKDYISAEKYYQELFTRHPGAGDVAYEARFWAGKSALAGQRSGDARVYFSDLIYLTNAPQALVARTYLALGETLFQQYLAHQTNEDYLSESIAAVSKCTNGAPTNAIAVEALGILGDYYMAWADQNPPTNYAIAKQMYQMIAHFPPDGANVPARDQAEFGLGLIAEREHQVEAALDHYMRVLDFDPDRFDAYWINRAGEYGARLCEDHQLWNEAVKVYDRVLAAVPALRPLLEKKITADQARLEARNH